MKAAVFEAVGVLSIEDRPEPRLEAPDDVKVRVLACGLCGTDVHILADPPGHPATPGVALGHEFVGEVSEVGPAVASVSVGQRVAVRPILTCGKCRQCLAGLPNHCAGMDALGVYRDGGLASHVVVPETACVPIDASIPTRIAALTEPLACVMHAVDRAGPRPGEDVVIIGAGAIGLLFLAVLRAAGAGRILVVEPAAARREVATRMKADSVIDPGDADLESAVLQQLPEGPQLVIDAVGSQLAAAVNIAARGGRIVLFGMNEHAQPEVRQVLITARELTIVGSYVGQHSFPDAVRLLESGRLDLAPIVSHVVGIDDVPTLIDRLRRGAVVKAVVALDERT